MSGDSCENSMRRPTGAPVRARFQSVTDCTHPRGRCMRRGHGRDARKSLVGRAATWQHGWMIDLSYRRVLVCAGLILMLAMGVRQTMGLLMPPMTIAHGWSRDDFAFAIALQNLLWGLSVPFAGAIADRFGAGRVLAASALLYALGLVSMATSETPLAFGMSAGLMIGIALSGTTFGVVLGVVAKAVPPEKRSVALGIASAGGSFGQFAMVPYGQALITGIGWYAALFVLAATAALIVPLAAGLAGRHGTALASTQSAGEAFHEAVGQRT